MAGITGKSYSEVDCHINVNEDDGVIIIPYKGVPDGWEGAPDIRSFRSLDRDFVFAGEQIQLLLCLSANKHYSGITTPFNDGIIQRFPRLNEKVVGRTNPVSQAKDANGGEQKNQNVEANRDIDSQEDASIAEPVLRREAHRRQTDHLLQSFKNSHFFARIAESNESLWSERSAREASLRSSVTSEEILIGDSSKSAASVKKKNTTSVMIDSGEFDSPTSGGVARGAVKCCSLSNGDIVVLLQVKVGVECMSDPILDILQYEKHHERNISPENQHILTSLIHDPYGELLNWLLPLNNSRRSARPLSPVLNSTSSIQSTSTKPRVSSGSELSSFSHIRSYSMSSLQPHSRPTQAITTTNAKPSFVTEDRNQYSFQSYMEIGKSNNELLSFRGVSLVPERFFVQCGLEGIFTPGRRWRKKLELIQPLEILTFSVNCNTDDLLCVHVKNVSPENAPDVVMFIDSITIVFEEALKYGPPLSLPITCTEAGNNYSLPNLALRRGEEHSFILKPARMLLDHSKGQTDSNVPPRHSSARASRSSQASRSSRASRSSWHRPSNIEMRLNEPPTVQYAVLVSCRCNYTDSKLFFKHPTNWQPRIARDLMIFVASEILTGTPASDRTQLPVQVLTLQASNMTSDDLTLTVIATEPNNDQICTHVWLQSRVPLGCVPSQSTATIKLALLPLTDGIINLDSLQIDVKEKGITYMPRHALKINATQALPQL